MTCILIKMGNLERDMHAGRMPPEDDSRDQGDTFTSLGTQRWPANQRKLGGRNATDSPS